MLSLKMGVSTDLVQYNYQRFHLRMDSIRLRLKRNCSLFSHAMTVLLNTHSSYENNTITDLLHVQPTLQVHILPCLGA
jgi:hypothetical protein